MLAVLRMRHCQTLVDWRVYCPRKNAPQPYFALCWPINTKHRYGFVIPFCLHDIVGWYRDVLRSNRVGGGWLVMLLMFLSLVVLRL
jgi:hypothetical protein